MAEEKKREKLMEDTNLPWDIAMEEELPPPPPPPPHHYRRGGYVPVPPHVLLAKGQKTLWEKLNQLEQILQDMMAQIQK